VSIANIANIANIAKIANIRLPVLMNQRRNMPVAHFNVGNVGNLGNVGNELTPDELPIRPIPSIVIPAEQILDRVEL
jgi:hypothetical protein